MSGILGIVHFDGRQAERQILGRMGAAVPWRAVDGEAIWVDGGAAIGHHHCRVTPESLTETQPFVSANVVVSFDGRIDNRDELLDSGTDDDSPDVALIVQAYRLAGERCVGRVVGDFAFALYDRSARHLILARDIMGARPLFYAQLRDGVAFASEIKSLLAHPEVSARPDEEGLADLVLNGFWDGHRTWFDRIWSVPPGAIVTASARGVRVTRVWDFDGRAIRYASLGDYIEHFRVLFAQAVRRRLRSAHPVAVAVSGGVDSSAIHCEAARLGPGIPLRGISLTYPRGTDADEHEFVDVLRRHGHDIDDVPVDRVRWLTGLDESVARTEMPNLLWDAHDALLVRARDAGCRVIVDGFFADQLLAGQIYLLDLARRGRWWTVRKHLHERTRWMTDANPRTFCRHFLSGVARASLPTPALEAARRTIGRARAVRRYPPWFTQAFRERAFQRALDRSPRPRRLGSEYAEECCRRATSGSYHRAVLQNSSAGVQYHIDTVYPYRDRDLVSFLMAIPGDIVSHNGVPKALLRYATDGVLPDQIRLRRSKGDGTAFSNGAALAEEPTLRRRFGPQALSTRAGYIDSSVLRSHFPAMFGAKLRHNDTAEFGWQIADTLALDLWLERFCKAGLCN